MPLPSIPPSAPGPQFSLDGTTQTSRGLTYPLPLPTNRFDGVAVYDAVVGLTSGGLTPISSATLPNGGLWVAADVGKLITYRQYQQVSPKYASGVITSLSGDRTTAFCTMATALTGSQLTAATVVYGTDALAYLVAQMAIAKAQQRSLLLPYGIACFSGQFTVPEGVVLQGRGWNTGVGSSKDFKYCGTSLVLCANIPAVNDHFIKLNDADITYGGLSNAHNKNQSGLRWLNVDANFQAFYVVDMNGGFDNFIIECSVNRPVSFASSSACVFLCNSGRVYGCFLDAHSSGYCWLAQVVSDIKMAHNWIASPQSGVYCGKVSGCTNVMYGPSNHSFRNGTTPGTGGQVYVESFNATPNQGVQIFDNVFDTSAGPHVLVIATGGSNMQNISILDNQCEQNDSIGASLYPAFEVSNASGCTITGLTISGNKPISSFGTAGNGVYTSFLKIANAGAMYADNVSNNTGLRCNTIFENVTNKRLPARHAGNMIRVGTTTTQASSDAFGRFVGDGTAAQTVYTFAHGLDASVWSVGNILVSPGSLASIGFFATADATNITVTFTVAPAIGTGNVVINWSASL